MGGGNAVFCYAGMKVIGNRMIDTFEKEHIRLLEEQFGNIGRINNSGCSRNDYI